MLSWRTPDLYIKLIRVIFKLILIYLLSYKLHFVTVIQRFCLLLHFKNFITIFVCKLLYCILIPRNNYISILVNLGLDSDKSILIILIIIAWIFQDLKPTELPNSLPLADRGALSVRVCQSCLKTQSLTVEHIGYYVTLHAC